MDSSINFRFNNGVTSYATPQQGTSNDEKKAQAASLNDIHKWDFSLGQDAQKFETADQLINMGQELPELRQPESSFKSKSDFFAHLSRDCVDLFIHLRKNPDLINAQDENGMTILHHAASIGRVMGSNSASLILVPLFAAPGIDFSIKDENGNTPVHIAGLNSDERVSCRFIFPNFVKAAIAQGFDCSTAGFRGYTILHIAAQCTYVASFTGRDENLSRILKILVESNIPNLKAVLNTLATSGAPVLFYSVNRLSLAEAKFLIDAGANPACGSEGRNPLKDIKETIAAFTEQLQDLEDQNIISSAKQKICELVDFEKYMSEHAVIKQ